VDTGLTMKYLFDHLNKKNCKSIKVCSLLQKPSKMKSDVYVDYPGFIIDDDFVVGFGLDYNEDYRTLPEIFKLFPEHLVI
jgi:hypoxanthine phosphoribosyltransferase